MRRGNGEGSIYKLGGKRRRPWAVRVTAGWTLEGKQLYKYVGYYKTKTEAKEALRGYLMNPYDLSSKDVKLIEVFKEWHETSDLADKTKRNYTSAFNQAVTLHRVPLRDIKAAHLENAMVPMSDHMKRVFKNCMNQIYIHAMKYEIVDKNIMELVTVKDVKIEERVPFTPEEIEKVRGFKHPLNDTAIILLYTGLRITELLEIETKNVFLNEKYMIAGKKTKAGTDRVIPLHDEIVPLVSARYAQGNKYLVTRENKKIPYRSYRQIYWDKMTAALEMKHTPHDTRHTFATAADRCNLNRIAVKRIMGHAVKDVTEHYTHKNIDELLTEVNKIVYCK